MKKVASIFAVMVMSVGLFASCESETKVDENDALYDVQIDATDRAHNETTQRE
ncbi:hypothetical protein RQM65_18520 [Pricia sp. S334]|uniref:Secreted protein n=1 Tax=Pricia mediterranea TaxID=3076079 RepID=A0ABU3LAH9_9FLAO|nr:hypothetical protein [Pricia sp. S334]MDT7830670.1 hypothetical protein [Pricia sp. S334]